MCDSAPSVCERAHGTEDKIITMVTTGCGLPQGMLEESHTDANSWRGKHTHKHTKANIHTHKNFTHIKTSHTLITAHRECTHTQIGLHVGIQQRQTRIDT